jgi:hypothetical protein
MISGGKMNAFILQGIIYPAIFDSNTALNGPVAMPSAEGCIVYLHMAR